MLPVEILEIETHNLCRLYKVDPLIAQQALLESFSSNPSLCRSVRERHLTEDVTRLAAYREAVKRARKAVYYGLRQYRVDGAAGHLLLEQFEQLINAHVDAPALAPVINRLLQSHVSTRERSAFGDIFYSRLAEVIGAPKTVIDIGCGLQPLAYLFENSKGHPDRYLAIDKDPVSCRILDPFSRYLSATSLTAVQAELADTRWEDFVGNFGRSSMFDLALMLKLIPVVYRQERSLLPLLAEVPARQIVVTASSESMTKNRDISRREDRILREFIAISGRPVIASLPAGTEFGYVLGQR